jgi:hypothetical protein
VIPLPLLHPPPPRGMGPSRNTVAPGFFFYAINAGSLGPETQALGRGAAGAFWTAVVRNVRDQAAQGPGEPPGSST